MATFRFLAILGVASLCIGSAFTAEALQGGSRARAQQMVLQAQVQHERLLARVPRLAEIDAVVRADCASRNRGMASDSPFCRCASAVTTMLWRSGADPQMVPRLVEFANGRGAATAEDFLAYQGPELYRGICRIATSG